VKQHGFLLLGEYVFLEEPSEHLVNAYHVVLFDLTVNDAIRQANDVILADKGVLVNRLLSGNPPEYGGVTVVDQYRDELPDGCCVPLPIEGIFAIG